MLEVRSGIADPTPVTPPRPPGSVRRTSHIDIAFDGGGGLVLRGAARDLRTRAGRGEQVAAGSVEAHLDATHALTVLDTTPPDDRTDTLVGRHVGSGFRATLDEAMPDHRDAATPLYLLLDELPVAALISGYALLYRGDLTGERLAAGEIKADVCAGWRSDGTMVVSLRTKGRMPVPIGPPTTRLEPADDPSAWHEIGPLALGAMRRRRLVEVTAADPPAVYAMFRDTHVEPSGVETVLHEYSLSAHIDPESLTISHCQARPRVLPWVECPAAAASASRLDGHTVGDVRAMVGRQFRGTTTCTHLNDLLRSLGDLGALVTVLRSG
jgi:hypothetical protein